MTTSDDNILPLFGGVSTQTLKTKSTPVYMAIVLEGGSGSTLLTASAPANMVQVDEAVDCTVDKSLFGDWLVSTFGMKLVNITIEGMDIYWTSCKSTKTASIQTLFDSNNVYKNPDARVKISITTDNGAAVYNCVLISLTRKGQARKPGDNGPIGAGAYRIKLIGIKA